MSCAPGPGELILAPRCCRLLWQNTCPGPTQPQHCQSPAAHPEPCLSFPIASCREGSGGALGHVPTAVPPANETAQPWQHGRRNSVAWQNRGWVGTSPTGHKARLAACCGVWGGCRAPSGEQGYVVPKSFGHGMCPAAEWLCRAPTAPAQQDPNPPQVEGCEPIAPCGRPQPQYRQDLTRQNARIRPHPVAASTTGRQQHQPEQPVPPCTGLGST